MDIQPVAEPIIEPALEPIKPVINRFNSTLERDKYILDRFSKGIQQYKIAEEVGLSEVRIGQIVRKNRASVIIDKEFERARRFRRLKFAEERSSKAIVAKDSDQLVRLIEAQRKEIEGDSPSGNTTNVQINIASVEINNKQQADLWELARKLLD